MLLTGGISSQVGGEISPLAGAKKTPYRGGSCSLCPYKDRPHASPSGPKDKNFRFRALKRQGLWLQVHLGEKMYEGRSWGQQRPHYLCSNCNDSSFLNANFQVFQGIILLSVNNTDSTADRLFILQERRWPASALGDC